MLIVLLVVVVTLSLSLQNYKTRHTSLLYTANKQKLISLVCVFANNNRNNREEALDKIDIEKIELMKRAQEIEIMKINAEHIRINQSRVCVIIIIIIIIITTITIIIFTIISITTLALILL